MKALTVKINRRFFYVGYSASRFCDEAVMFLVPVLVYMHTGDITKSGLTFAIEWAPRLATLLFVGVFIDRYGARLLVLVAELLRVGSFLCIAAVLSLDGDAVFVALNVLVAFTGVVAEIGYVANEVLIIDVFRNTFTVAQRWSQAVDQTLRIAVPACAVILLDQLALPMILCGFAGLVCINIAVIVAIAARRPTAESQGDVLKELASGWVLIATDRRLLAISTIAFLLNFIAGLVLATMNYFVVGVLGGASSAVATVAVAAALGSVIILYLTQRRELGKLDFVCWSAFLLGCFAVMREAWSIELFGAFYVGFSVAVSMLSLVIRSTRAHLVPPRELGKIVGTMIFMNSCSLPLAGIVVYRFADVSLGRIWWGASGALLAALCGFVIAGRRRSPTGKGAAKKWGHLLQMRVWQSFGEHRARSHGPGGQHDEQGPAGVRPSGSHLP
jgi:hypothetical protein